MRGEVPTWGGRQLCKWFELLCGKAGGLRFSARKASRRIGGGMDGRRH